MANKVPVCLECDFYCHEAANDFHIPRDLCHHPVYRVFRSTGGKRWIPSRERGKTSPQWCPLRKRKEA